MVLGSSNLGFGSPGTSGSIVIAVDNGGSGYESAPSVTVGAAPGVAGNTAAASSVLGTVGRVNRVAFTQRGLFDTSSSGAVSFTAGGGVTPTSSATGTYNMRAASGRVTAITIVNGGSGYKVKPAVTIAGSEPAIAEAVITDGVVTSINITNPGQGYTAAPAVTIAAPPLGGTGATATATVTEYPGKFEIGTVTMTALGANYLSATAVFGTLPAAVTAPAATGVIGRSVAQIVVSKPGVGYLSAPGVTIDTPVANSVETGVRATATATLAAATQDPDASPLTSGVGANFIEGFQTIDGSTLGQGSGSIYGGSNDNDNSGLIRFASIRYGGFILSPNNEINGLTTGATGRGTYFEFIEVVNNADDDFEHFGGLCNMKYVAGLFGGDDGFDFDQGYRGKIQFALQVQNNKFGLNGTTGDTGRSSSNVGDNLGEFDGSEAPNTSKPYSVWTMFNYTGIGVGYGAANPVDKAGPNFKDNAGGKVFNSLYVNAPLGAVQIQGTATEQAGAHAIARFQEKRTSGGEFNEINGTGAASEPDAILNYVTWMRCGADTDAVATDTQLFPTTSGRTTSGGSAINDANIVLKIKTNNQNNIFQGGIELENINVFALDPRLKSSTASRSNGVSPRTGASSVDSGTAGGIAGAVDRGDFFTDNTFRGAMKDCNWLNGWSLLNEWGTMSEGNNTPTPDVTLNRTGGKLIVSFPGVAGVQYSVETSSNNKTYTPKRTITGAASNDVDLGSSTALTFVRVLPL